jgi:tRNA-intron endonuclease
MSEEQEIDGVLLDDHVVIPDKKTFESLEQKGYGEARQAKFLLKPFEALYFAFYKKLSLSGRPASFEALLHTCAKFDHDALTKFLVYRDLRVRGYTVKDGFGFGTDFRVYERGHFGQKGAKYLVFGLSEGRQEKIGNLHKNVDQITSMGKEPILAVIERRGEVIYYKISSVRFAENKLGPAD